MKVWGKKMWESIKCTPYYGPLKASETPIGNMINVCKWEIIHQNETWQKQKVWGQVQKDLHSERMHF
jgi:hypothetical protein